MKQDILFTPYNLAGLSLNNRIVMAPMTRSRADNAENAPTALIAEYYAQRASAGLLITEGAPVNKKGVGYINVPGIYSAAQVEGWKLVTKAVHQEGGKIFVQLWHVGRISHPDFHNGELPHAPSAINPNEKSYTVNGFVDTVVPKEMTLADIQQTIQDFKQAAANAVAAGFDGVEIHGANGYLLHQFFNSTANHRTDAYGGSIENHARILFDILEAMKEVIDIQRVGIRLSPSLNGLFGITMDENTIPTFEYIVKKLNNYPLAYLHLTEPFAPVDHLPFAVTQVAKHFRPLYQGTLMINKGFNKASANAVLDAGDADLVSFGVPFLANPDLVERFQQDAPLNAPDQSTFYTPGTKGYTDYPFLQTSELLS
ncbi:MAG: alkene reductase [Hydrotalea sp. AMD]|uniref:alkene reductase n=1 Tax=Hydrotalea sp. AMD TaxID=2501297 RepID=UPI0009429AD7|nr:alkene reductase [Hydrotalea sp. AMD]RWZ88554.1 MAG: alkene reductase [Hydrotalea sp. AMD]